MLAAYVSSNDESSNCAKLLGTGTPKKEGGLISNNTNLISASYDGGFDTCSFYSGPSDDAIIAFAEGSESCGSIAFGAGSESCGSIAFSGGGESCGSVASSCGGSFSSGGGSASFC